MIILKWMLMGLEGMDRSHLSEDRDNGWGVVSMVMNPWVP